MARCHPHRQQEPCFYCQKGYGPFASSDERMEALESRVRLLEQGRQTLGNLDIRQAVAVVREGGVGDLVMLSGCLRALNAKDSSRPLVLLTKPENIPVLEGAPYLDAILPMDEWKGAQFHKIYDLQRAVETTYLKGKLTYEEFMATDRVTKFAQLLGFSEAPKRFGVPICPWTLSRMRGILKNCKHPIIGIGATCRSPLRTIPTEYVEPLAKMVQEHYQGTVVLLGRTTSWSKHLADIHGDHIINMVNHTNYQDLIAMISVMDAMISADTGSSHIAGALGIKCLTLYGNNKPEIFMAQYPTVKPLTPEGDLPCVPCGDQRISCALEPGKPGADCMRLLTPERVTAAMAKFYNGKNIAFVRDTPLHSIGGAELSDCMAVKAGRDLGYNVRVFDRDTPADLMHSLFDYDLIILSNIWELGNEHLDIIKKAIKVVPFVKCEHDHRAIDQFGHHPFTQQLYKESRLNVFVSPDHQDDYRQAFGVDGVCVPPLIDVDLFQANGTKRHLNTALVGTPPKADKKELENFIKKNKNLKFDYMTKNVPHDQMPGLYSQYECLVHLPQRKWSCERIIFEAALCGCKVVANSNAEGMSWGRDLTDQAGLRAWIKEAPAVFWKEIEGVIP